MGFVLRGWIEKVQSFNNLICDNMCVLTVVLIGHVVNVRIYQYINRVCHAQHVPVLAPLDDFRETPPINNVSSSIYSSWRVKPHSRLNNQRTYHHHILS